METTNKIPRGSEWDTVKVATTCILCSCAKRIPVGIFRHVPKEVNIGRSSARKHESPNVSSILQPHRATPGGEEGLVLAGAVDVAVKVSSHDDTWQYGPGYVLNVDPHIDTALTTVDCERLFKLHIPIKRLACNE